MGQLMIEYIGYGVNGWAVDHGLDNQMSAGRGTIWIDKRKQKQSEQLKVVIDILYFKLHGK